MVFWHHLLRFRDVLRTYKEATNWQPSEGTVKRVTELFKRIEGLIPLLQKIADGKGVVAIFAKAMIYNYEDYTEKLKEIGLLKS